MKRYEALAADIEVSILNGTLSAGDKLPSVRHTGTSRGVSATTVFNAYYLLEARGHIRAKDRSGYYVTSKGIRRLPPEAERSSTPQGESITLDVSDQVFRILESSMSRAVVPLGSAFPSPMLFPMERLGQAMSASMRSLDPWSTVDDLTPGHGPLRKQIALRYMADGMPVAMDELVVTNGALEALNLCLAAVTRPGDSVIVESPTFYAALQALERLGLKAIEVPTHPRDGIDIDALEQRLKHQRPSACWLMTTFQNPLGSLMPEAKKRALVELLSRSGIPLIEDDVYAELYYGEKRPLPAKAFDTQGIVMHCSSFSKSMAPGYRVGWVAAGSRAREIARLKLTSSLGAPLPTQMAVARYLETGAFDKHLRRLRQALEGQLANFAHGVGHYFPTGTHATRPLGGYFMWLELPSHVNALDIHQEALQRGISVAPGPIFSASEGFTNCLRLNYGHPWTMQIENALQTLGNIVEARC